jgi:hypothetical protein
MRRKTPDLRNVTWRVPSSCMASECLEVADCGDMIAVRNSASPAEVVWFNRPEWRDFIIGVRAGDFGDMIDAPDSGTAPS